MTWRAGLRERLRPTHWLPVALSHPQRLVRVMLVTRARRLDVTERNVVAALDPLTVALPASDELSATLDGGVLHLEFVDAADGFTLGRLRLTDAHTRRLASQEAILFRVSWGADYCENWAQRAFGRLARHVRARRKSGPSGGLRMPPAAVERLLTFYLCPRPVVLVSACEGEQGNLFPMDLLGPFGEGRFALALRNTSPSVATMKRGGMLVLSDIPPRECATAYRLGAHHKAAAIDWNRLPFPVHRTTRSSLPYPAIALRIRELALLDHADTGSHSFFIAEIIADQSLSAEPRLFHTTSSHQRYRTSLGTPLVSALPDRSESGSIS